MTDLVERIRELISNATFSKFTGTVVISFDAGRVVAITKSETEKFVAADAGPRNVEKR